MGFNKDLDKTLWSTDIKDGDDILRVSINCYNEGTRKLQIGPRVVIKQDGSESYRKAGRMSVFETSQLFSLTEEIENIMENEIND